MQPGLCWEDGRSSPPHARGAARVALGPPTSRARNLPWLHQASNTAAALGRSLHWVLLSSGSEGLEMARMESKECCLCGQAPRVQGWPCHSQLQSLETALTLLPVAKERLKTSCVFLENETYPSKRLSNITSSATPFPTSDSSPSLN